MSKSRMIQLAEELLEQSKAERVNWEESSSNSFAVKFPDVSLQIIRLSGAEYILQLENQEGRRLDTINGRRGSPEYDVLKGIFDLAERTALDVEQSIDKALEYLKGA